MLNFFKKILTKRSKADTHSSSGDDKEFDLEPKIETDIAKIIQEAAQGNKKLLLRHKY